jgi:hypothetical protein
MSTPAQVGKHEWKAALEEARAANAEMRTVLKRLVREGGPLAQALTQLMVLNLMDNEAALSRLEQIGRNTERRG